MFRHRVIPTLLVAAALGMAGAAPLSFVLDTVENRSDEAQAIAAQLQEIGVDAQVRIWQSTVLRDELLAGTRTASMSDWGSAYFDPFDLAIPKFRTADRGNYSGYSNPDVDAAFATASTTVDSAAREQAYQDAQRRIHADAPWIFGYVLQNIEAASSAVSGWQPAADNSESMHRVTVAGEDTIIIGLRTDSIITLDPAMYRDRETGAVLRNIYDSLITSTPDGNIEPMLAASWDVVDDRTFEFSLQPDVHFTNGDPLTASDVVFTFNRILEEGAIGGATSPRAGLLGPLESVEKVDDLTVRFNYSETFPAELLLQALVQFQVVPEAYVTEVGADAFAEAPIGSGPFSFVRGELDSQIVLKRNPDYWNGAPELEGVIFRMMPEPSTRLAALLSGEVHIIQAVSPDLVERLSGAPNIEVKTAPGTRSYQIELNNAEGPFTDVRVRQALNHAVNWDDILGNIYRGYADRLSTGFLPSGFGFDTELEPYGYDPEKARELLREAGYDVR